jgi:hypothetical protein
MRSGFTIFGIAIVALTLCGTTAQAEEIRCQAIRDSAQCVAQPECW